MSIFGWRCLADDDAQGTAPVMMELHIADGVNTAVDCIYYRNELLFDTVSSTLRVPSLLINSCIHNVNNSFVVMVVILEFLRQL